MLQKLMVAIGFMVTAVLFAPAAHAEDGITITIAKHARLEADGRVEITAFVRCGPLPGAEDFTEAHAGIGQARTGGAGEGGLDGTVICDGVERAYTAHFSSFGEPFKPGPARANVSMIACRLVDGEQVCFTDSETRQVIITRRR